jgi:hypothetical protein
MTVAATIAEDRLLTTDEVTLIQWLLEHGTTDAAGFLPQVAKARVVSRCQCGCPSIYFAVDGVGPPVGSGMYILADYQWQAANGALFGVFVFARDAILSGLEVWSVDGLAIMSELPAIEQLQKLVFTDGAEPAAAAFCGEVVMVRPV